MKLETPRTHTKRIALFMDFDGTLVELAAKPHNVVVPPSTLSLLASLQEKTDGATAIVSGRRITDLDHILTPLRLPASGCLGAEIRLEKEDDIHTLTEPLPASIMHNLQSTARRLPGVTFENKVFGACLHFDNARSGRDILEHAMETIAADLPESVEIIFTKHSCEIKHHDLNKGSAVRNFYLTPTFKDRLPIYIGNDILDHEAFSAVRAMGGISMSVGSRSLSTDVDFTLNSVKEAHKWLDAI